MLRVPTSTFTIKNLLRHGHLAFRHSKLDVKWGHLKYTGSSPGDVKLREGALTALAVSVIVPGLVSGV